MEIKTIFPNSCQMKERKAINALISLSINHSGSLVEAIERADKVLSRLPAGNKSLGLCRYTVRIEGKAIPSIVVSERVKQ